jgi:hypothetical protein
MSSRLPVPTLEPRSEEMEEEFDRILREEDDEDADYFDEE